MMFGTNLPTMSRKTDNEFNITNVDQISVAKNKKGRLKTTEKRHGTEVTNKTVKENSSLYLM